MTQERDYSAAMAEQLLLKVQCVLGLAQKAKKLRQFVLAL